jgi:hypothetical protein
MLGVGFTTRPRWLAVRTVALVLVIFVSAGCSGRSDPGAERPASECPPVGEASAESPLTLVSCRPGAPPSSLSFFVGLANTSAEPLSVAARFEPFSRFSVHAADVSGRELEPAVIWESSDIGLELSTHLLPRGGVFGRWIDLSCGTPDFGGALECRPMFDFTPGMYTVWFEYEDLTACLGGVCADSTTWTGSLTSRSNELRIPR